jgi:hypothetical protein
VQLNIWQVASMFCTLSVQYFNWLISLNELYLRKIFEIVTCCVSIFAQCK